MSDTMREGWLRDKSVDPKPEPQTIKLSDAQIQQIVGLVIDFVLNAIKNDEKNVKTELKNALK